MEEQQKRFYIRLTISLLCFNVAFAKNIQLLQCPPPNFPQFGGYGPRQDFYTPGDVIHYYCNVDNYIGGNYLRFCQDSGDWIGDTPVCDATVIFTSIEQSSTAAPVDRNAAESASDGNRETCSSTQSLPGSEWIGHFSEDHHVLRVMLFLPKNDVAYEVFSVKADGSEYSCGKTQRRIETYNWIFHNCLEPNNTHIRSIKIKSLNSSPLELCEVVVHSLTDPTCVDPHQYVDNGRLMLSRKSAFLVCDKGFRKSRTSKLTCIRTGVWTRRNLQCFENDRDVEGIDPVDSDDTENTTRRSNPRPAGDGPERERNTERETK